MDDQAYADALLAAALQYATDGLYVFPARVKPSESGEKKVVQPIAQWRKAATRNPAEIERWWGEGGPWHGAHVCIDTGGSGLVALDGDGKRGMDALHELVEAGMPLGNAVTTPGGGQHWYYAEDYRRVVGIDSTGKVAPGVDVRGMGGFVFAPPSRDWRGAYEWLDRPVHWDGLTVIPDVIIERMRAKEALTSEVPPVPQDQGDARGTGGTAPFDVPARQFTRQAAIEFCMPAMGALKAAPTGTINARLNDAAKTLSHFGPEFWSRDEATGWLMNALKSTEYDGATWRAADTIGSAYRSAGQDWRAELVPDPFATPNAGQPPEPTAVDAMLAEMLTPDQLIERPPPTPLIMDWLDLDSLAYLIGKPGSYKSFLALDYAAHVGQGVPWRGHPVHQGEVVYLVAEGTTGMGLRVRAWQERHGPMKAVRFLPRPVQASGAEWAVLVEACRRIAPVLVVLDTQARVTVGMDENDNTEMGKFIHRAEELRAATGACVLVVHHIGRNGEDARGASALDGAQSTEIKIKRSDRGPLWAVIGQDKQKDMAEAEDLEVGLDVVELGRHPVTMRPLSSLVLAPVNPFDVTRERKPVQDWIDRLAENQADLFGVMSDIYAPGSATKAELRASVKERRADQGRPEMPKQSFDKAFNALIHKELFVQIRGAQRYMIDPGRISTESDQDIDDHRGDDFAVGGQSNEDQMGSDLRPPASPTSMIIEGT